MSITNGIQLIQLVRSIDPDSNKFREHHFSGLDQVLHLVVSADIEPDPLKTIVCEHRASCFPHANVKMIFFSKQLSFSLLRFWFKVLC